MQKKQLEAMESLPQPAKVLSNIRLRGQHKRQVASRLRALHSASDPAASPKSSTSIRVVCISDTHNTRPVLPPGDVLIHAGDLTENGSFDEVQAELAWLSGQPHQYKIFIAGNHDVLLDDAFLERYPERRYGQNKTKDDLDWGSVIYLQDSIATLNFSPSTSDATGEGNNLKKGCQLTVFGSPWTPQYGISAFQYRPEDADLWASRHANLGNPMPDIIVTHGPPKHHLDARDFHRAGCPYLASDLISKVRPRLSVFGHIHASYGREDVCLDTVQSIYEEVMTGWAGWGRVGWMAVLVFWGKLTGRRRKIATTFVNASIVGGSKNEILNEPIVVDL